MKMENLIVLATAGQILVESTACTYLLFRSFSNIMLSGSKASHIFSESVAIAAQRGMEECRHQFEWERWDCPKSSFNVFSKSTSQPATREMAFLHAIVSAAIVITLTRNCSLGHFDSCGCDKTKNGAIDYKGWSWGGCSDNIMIGNKMAKEFLDAKEMGRDAKALINLHNNKVGRTLVKKTMRRLCKCHGVSGSCATQTCWMRMEDLRQVGNHLKNAYKTAVRVDYNGFGNLLATKQRKQRGENSASSSHRLKVPRHQLIYMTPSPNYCLANQTAGIAGTKGRQCSRRRGSDVSESERVSCRTLCRGCGLRVRKKSVNVETSCRCKFYWCCDVKCDLCKEKVTQFICG
ncbi:protein Wnt-8b-like [Uloborus diversus]|uniref:protein Wnt-8b-like n=1 Tax=Uloborus diversus TaxID=327109 RepID=UPI0024092516|nr:protein Wnt-8b-like [Uloborus diversus]